MTHRTSTYFRDYLPGILLHLVIKYSFAFSNKAHVSSSISNINLSNRSTYETHNAKYITRTIQSLMITANILLKFLNISS